MRQPHVHHPTNPIPRAQPAHHFVRANRCYPSSQAGRAWKPAPTLGGEGECVQPPSSVIRRKGRRGRRPLRWFAYFTLRHVTQGRSPRTILYGCPRLSFIPGRAGVEDKPLRVVRNAQKGPVCGPVLFALKCPRAFQAVFFTSTAHPRRRGWRLGRRRRRLWRR